MALVFPSCKRKLNTPFFDSAFSLSKDELFNTTDWTLIDDEHLSARHLLFDELYSSGHIDLDTIQIGVLDSYFFGFKDYWEDAISGLKRKSAIINRRKYLVDLTNSFINLLTQRGITKYKQLLTEYQEFNQSELITLQQ